MLTYRGDEICAVVGDRRKEGTITVHAADEGAEHHAVAREHGATTRCTGGKGGGLCLV